ncbi:MAG TPA: Asp-tRNA(Asn)/Glu-tRNA(Gln) amidotransferase subunit GatB [Candidatus Portnoybacteria bacterium]|nr:Asp-tRNA(Asn)/Glu-tRNA(Gln) amidotransferase subunit GatB [Candidatus Portnoybacteria bacterium]
METVIGLEIHAELKTKSKVFCRCQNVSSNLESEPNKYICPVCTGQPGALPVLNKEAVRLVLLVGKALHCQIADLTKFDRKSYFYPDLPKGYQISQYDLPLCQNGYLEITDDQGNPKKIRINRIHLEEDTAKLIHQPGKDYSLVDFNRSGVPLMELVTEPDIRSGKEAHQFAQQVQLIFRYLNASEANMEKGQMRCEVNISIRPKGSQKLGTKVEVKNLNSFRAVEKASDYEFNRQKEALEFNEEIVQETRGWNVAKQMTISQRKKEEAADYRYFPEPDLPPLRISSLNFNLSLPELPEQKRKRLINEYNISQENTDVLIAHPGLSNYFENVCSELPQVEEADQQIKTNLIKPIKIAVNYLINDLPLITNLSLNEIEKILSNKITSENFAELAVIISQGKINSTAAQDVLKEMWQTGDDPTHIIQEKNLEQVQDEASLDKFIQEAIQENPSAIHDYRKGKTNAVQFLVGQIMKKTRGQASPQVVRELIIKKLGE